MKKLRPRPHPDMAEGQEAYDRFRQAVRAVLKVPKIAVPPSPFGKPKATAKAV